MPGMNPDEPVGMAMSGPGGRGIRWIFAERLAHVVAEDASETTERVAVCGLAVAATATVYRVAPSLDLCRACQRLTLLAVASPEFPTTPTVF
ncbi:MAG: hypothetical protein ACRDRV_14280 [Pseudonocardiaceae bacterium]